MERLPGPIVIQLTNTFTTLGIDLFIVNDRKTKLGDWSFKNGRHIITINNNLVPEQFFMTLVHELAHATTWNKYMNSVKPHGKEWKQEFRSHMLPLLTGNFSPEVEEALRDHMKNPSACSGRSLALSRAINQESMFVEDIPFGITFKVKNGLLLEKIEKKRTRWLCKVPTTGERFIVPGSLEAF